MNNENSIKPLHTTMTKLPKVYEQVTEYVDNQTGEIISKAQTFVRQVNSRDEFVKLYLENIEFVTKNLNDGELRLLLYATSMVNYNNIFRFDKNFMGYFISNEIMKKSAIYKHFKTLVEKNVFINITDEEIKAKFKIFGDDAYFIHPDIVSKKSFKELLELKRTIVQTFDFEKFTMKQEVQTQTKYEGFNEIAENLEAHEVKQINQYASNDGKHIETEIVIGEKEEQKYNNEIIDIEVQDDNKEKSLFSESDLNEQEEQKENQEVQAYEDNVPPHLERTKYDKKFKNKVEAGVARILKLENDLLKERLALREHYLEIGDIEKASAINMDVR